MGVSRDAVTVHIETLVLHGFPGGSRHDIGDALQAELARLLAADGIADTVAHAEGNAVVDGGEFTLPARGDVHASGAGIAQRVHASLSDQGGEDHESS